jgi:hypothetical protein
MLAQQRVLVVLKLGSAGNVLELQVLDVCEEVEARPSKQISFIVPFALLFFHL